MGLLDIIVRYFIGRKQAQEIGGLLQWRIDFFRSYTAALASFGYRVPVFKLYTSQVLKQTMAA
jgi:dienelactone hydrolase